MQETSWEATRAAHLRDGGKLAQAEAMKMER